ncbi:MAG TPA: hypothetical protein VK590_08500 [Saprospiraceae bacterium]|nr:hypothetical protein [Saprospiraceae bacterium]
MTEYDIRNISNIKVNKDCYKSLKKLSIDKEVSLQQVVREVLEQYTTKKIKQNKDKDDDNNTI